MSEALTIPPGEYAIVELFGHQTLVGRIAEVDRFGARMLALEPLFGGKMLPPVFHGGAAIYRLTPCSPEIAWSRQPQHTYQLPAAILAIVPRGALPSPTGEDDDEAGCKSGSADDPDEPVVDVAVDDPAWLRSCPKCNAKPDDECTSLVSGCVIEEVHAERTQA